MGSSSSSSSTGDSNGSHKDDHPNPSIWDQFKPILVGADAPSRNSSSTSSKANVDSDNKDKDDPPIVDAVPQTNPSGSRWGRKRLPPATHLEEYPSTTSTTDLPKDNKQRQIYMKQQDQQHRRNLATLRIVKMALQRVIEPPTLHLMVAAAGAVLTLGVIEGTLLAQEWPWPIPNGNTDTCKFVLRYSIEQLFPSVVWETQDPQLVAIAMGVDPNTVLRDLTVSGTMTTQDANILLLTRLIATSRSFWHGFMMIAQLVRAANVSLGAFEHYEQRIKLGQEPPLVIPHGLVVRFCGRDSHATEVSLQRMGPHIFPVYEDPERVQFLVWKHAEGTRRPVYWCVKPGLYGSSYSWNRFPVGEECFVTANVATTPTTSNTTTKGVNVNVDVKQANNDSDRLAKILILEADGTNGNDPLTLGETALDLTLEDASQGFRRILERYAAAGWQRDRDFRTLRVYLGNSMEVATTGGGHKYTLRHRIKYSKEMDVLVDSRAAVLQRILEWCRRVTASQEDGHKQIFFQTSSRDYFLNLQRLLREYGYELYDPLDLKIMDKMQEVVATASATDDGGEEKFEDKKDANTAHNYNNKRSLLRVMIEDTDHFYAELEDHIHFMKEMSSLYGDKKVAADMDVPDHQFKSEMLRRVAKMAKIPRLVHMKTTAETVNAVEALIWAGEVDASNCCALIDREDGVRALERTLEQKASGFVRDQRHQWRKRDDSRGSSSLRDVDDEDLSEGQEQQARLDIICSSSIHDESLRQIRTWARMGYSAAEIQREIDTQYQEILAQSHSIQREVSKEEEAVQKESKDASPQTKQDQEEEMPTIMDVPESKQPEEEEEPPAK